MPKERIAEYEKDHLPSRMMIDRYYSLVLRDGDEAVRWDINLLSYRGTEEELAIGQEFCLSEDPIKRQIGADLLGQLGWDDYAFLRETVDALIPLLTDPNPEVAYSAGVALGHRSDPRSIPYLVAQVAHENARVRYGVAFGLLGHDEPNAIAALLQLAKDTDPDVRNWAVFGLGAMITADSVPIREVLWTAVTDSDPDVRHEGLVGLAMRKDPCTAEAILEDCSRHGVTSRSLEAAEELGNPQLIATVAELLDLLESDEDLPKG